MKTLNKLGVIKDEYLKEVCGGAVSGGGNVEVELETIGRRPVVLAEFTFPAQDIRRTESILAHLGLKITEVAQPA